METLWQDLRYGIRMLGRSPGFTIVAVLTLALGVGANTAIFSVLHAVLFKALPYPEPDRLVMVWGNERDVNNPRSQVSATDVMDWRAQNHVFEDVTTVSGFYTPTLTGNGEPERISAAIVGDGYFQIMRGKPLLGRFFTPEENIDGKDNVAVLCYGLWQRRFGGDPGVIGRSILLNSRPHTVVGIMPPDFRSLPYSILTGPPAELYRPVGENYAETDRNSRHLRAIARLKPGVTLRQAQADMDAIALRIEKEHPRESTGYGVHVVSLQEDLVGGIRPALLMLFGAVGLVLLIACANVANLLLARSAARQREIAVRSALGAGRSRLVRQFLTESVLLALEGGLLGILFALWGTSLIESAGAKVIPSLASVEINFSVLGFALSLSLLTGIVFGVAPALTVTRVNLNEVLKEGGHSSGAASGRNPLRSSLVISEVALALVLLVTAGLLIRSLWELKHLNPGFNPSNLLTMNVPLPSAKYPKDEDRLTFYNRMIDRVEALPGVQSAGIVSVLPMGPTFDGRALQVEDRPKPPGQELSVATFVVTPGYLRAMQIPLQKGRFFAETDGESSAPVALVSETMARNLWPGENPLGKHLRISGSGKPIEQLQWRSVVGIVSDVKQVRLDAPGEMQVYVPESQIVNSYMTLVVRTRVRPASLAAAVRDQVHFLDKDQVVFQVATMDQLLSDSLALRRFSMLLLGWFAGVALLLAAVGLYGVISYTVSQRTQELGIRVALGAQPGDVLWLVFRNGFALVLAGLAAGILAALAMTRLLSSLLFGVRATDPATFVIVAAVLSVVALVACYVPARRATRVDPMVALRYE
ncbi:MAG: ABC transporter permease [Candidatus Acidiferrales bacterium]